MQQPKVDLLKSTKSSVSTVFMQQLKVDLTKPTRSSVSTVSMQQPKVDLPKSTRSSVSTVSMQQLKVDLPKPTRSSVSTVSMQQPKVDLPKSTRSSVSTVSMQQPKVNLPKPTRSSVSTASMQQSKVDLSKSTKSSESAASVQLKTTSSLDPSKPKVYNISNIPSKTLLPHVLIKSSVSDIPLSLLVDSGSSVSLLKHSCIMKHPKLTKDIIQLKGIDPTDNPVCTQGDTYPIPQITEILDQLGDSKYFSTLDLSSGFHQIQLNEADKSKTAFTIPEGHFQFTRMPFGLKNAPSTFQRMNSVLSGLQGKLNSAADALSRYPVNPIYPKNHTNLNPNNDEIPDDDLQNLLISPSSLEADLADPEINNELLDYLNDMLDNESPGKQPEPQLSSNQENLEILPSSVQSAPESPPLVPENLLSDRTAPETPPLIPEDSPSSNQTTPETSSIQFGSDETYNTFLKASKNVHDTLIIEHNENLLKTTQNLIIIPTSIDLDESMPYIQEIINSCSEPDRTYWPKVIRNLFIKST
ncbi:probable serine/threonine-protein kinase nek3 [Plodia interpunctella]|uniref:probable serine/threonine-protein kinase nek3 n=1 Tax=Plodia interpunctella TaxID=58824 RepID=UPI0031015BA5